MLRVDVAWYRLQCFDILQKWKVPFPLKKKNHQNSSTGKNPTRIVMQNSSCLAQNQHRTASDSLRLTKVQLHRDACSFFPDKCLGLLLYSLLYRVGSSSASIDAPPSWGLLSFFASSLQIFLASVYLTGDLSCCDLAMAGRQRLALSPS